MNHGNHTLLKKTFLLCSIAMTCVLSAQDENSKLLDDFVKSRGTGIISFDSENIKQFWVDKSVVARDKRIEIFFTNDNHQETNPLRFQLINVDESQDCIIEVVTDNPNMSFTVVDEGLNIISKSQQDDDFVQYHVLSSVVHLENTQNTSFSMIFSDKTSDVLSIRKIILSFRTNQNSTFLSSPGNLIFRKNLLDIAKGRISDISDTAFVVNGESVVELPFSSIKSFFVKDNSFNMKLKVKNTGKAPVDFYIGYKILDKKHTVLYRKNYPYKGITNLLNVVESSPNTNYIIVDTVPQWEKGCFIAVDAKEDCSDVPSMSFTNGTILDVQELENGHAKIILDKPQQNALKVGTQLRVHGHGGSYLYTNSKKIQPDEKVDFNSTIKKDGKTVNISNKALPKGTYSVKPVIVLVPKNRDEAISIEISDYCIFY